MEELPLIQGLQVDPEKEKKQMERKQKKQDKILEEKKKIKKNRQDKQHKKRAKKQQERKEMLEKMTVEERKEFIFRERTEKAAADEKMTKAMAEKRHELFFDLSFSHLMSESVIFLYHDNKKEMKSLCMQLSQSVNIVKKSKDPFTIHFCSFRDHIKSLMESMGCTKWTAYFHAEDICDLIPSITQNLVYLSPDSENTLEDFDSSTSFIIGGIVDKAVVPCSTLYKANLCKVRSAKLPLKETLVKVKKEALNIDTVVKILEKYLESKDWSKTLGNLMPERLLDQFVLLNNMRYVWRINGQ
eukprot:TRINITY_DN89915_c0_g1_i1.p3 TRINITY_DN89915_c0_g1~~TRINITY_DN89915_c0_g1_i1.p3  ORF type:complete len:300 (-),score=44.17 TRINITY_DN89915_c0_g1_i1:422-1321(-)